MGGSCVSTLQSREETEAVVVVAARGAAAASTVVSVTEEDAVVAEASAAAAAEEAEAEAVTQDVPVALVATTADLMAEEEVVECTEMHSILTNDLSEEMAAAAAS